MKGGTVTRVALALAAVLSALSLVAHRQGRGLRVLSSLDSLEARIEVELAREDEYVSEIRRLESLGVVEARAKAELGMHTPQGEELGFYGGTDR